MSIQIVSIGGYMKKVTVSVTRKDIDKGSQNSMFNCPIARALKRISPNRSPVVFKSKVIFQGEVRLLPDVAKNFIREFDKADLCQNGDAFEPFKFQIRAV